MNSKRMHPDEDGESDGMLQAKRPRERTFNIAPHGSLLHTTSYGTNHSPFAHHDYTIAWICALPLELAASRSMLDEEHSQLPNQPGDNNVYVRGRIEGHHVVMACLPGMYGTNNAAIVATNLKRSFPNIRATLMVGIGGGAPSQADLYLGDVVVGTRVMQYDLGKVLGDGVFQETADAKTPSWLLNSAISTLRSKHASHLSSSRMMSLLDSRLPRISRPDLPDLLFQASYDHPVGVPTCIDCDRGKLQPRGLRAPDEPPKIHYGVIASGNSVMRDATTRDAIARRLSALCFEMEAAGMMENSLECLPIRGICDYSDSHKNKAWQDYAAATAAAYARELLEVLPPASMEPALPTMGFSEASKPDTADDQVVERRQRLLESLNFPQIDARKTTIRSAHHRTCRWFLRHSAYRDWLNPAMQSQNHGFLWMRGKPGAGKSTIIKFAYLDSKKSDKPNAMIASFFFNARGDYLERSISGMYRSLLMQLLTKFPDLQTVLDDADIVPWSQQGCPDLDALKELLRNALMGLGPRSFTCFIDALDECDEQEVRDMVHFFEDLAETTTEDGTQLRICFSSRPYPYISIRRGISLTLEDEAGHAEDLAQYVKSKLTIDDPLLFADLQSQILTKASGIFLWIVLVVDMLNKEDDDGGLALRTKLSKIPDGLSELFKNILTRDQKSPERLLLCVLWILCAQRPLTPAEFRHALWVAMLDSSSEQKDCQVDPEVPDISMDACIKLVTSASKGLAEITKSKKPTVQFVHESVRDFLAKERGLQDLWPELGFKWEGSSHDRLKRCCTRYLALSGVMEEKGLWSIGEERRDMLAHKYPLLEYASQNVLHHANAAALVIPQDEFVSQFFKPMSASLGVLNLFEKKARRYSLLAHPSERFASVLYILADKGLANLIRAHTKGKPSGYGVSKASSAFTERYKFPFFAALANGRKDALAALLGLRSTIYDGIDIAEGFKYRKDLKGQGHEAVARFLIEKGADVNAKDGHGRTALIWAAEKGYEAVARLLIEHKANVNARDNEGSVAIVSAAYEGHEAIVRLLLDNGADVDEVDRQEITPVIFASIGGHAAVVKLLINRGADVDFVGRGGLTALTCASEQGREVIVRQLLGSGADPNRQGENGQTALMLAGDETIAKLLIDSGADINIRSGKGETAWDMAFSSGRLDVANFLGRVQPGIVKKIRR